MAMISTTRHVLGFSLRVGAFGLLLALTGHPLLAQQTPTPPPARVVPALPDLNAERAEREQQVREQRAERARQRQALEAWLAAQLAAQGPISTTAPSATFTVDDTGDDPDDTLDGTCATAGNVCTLRAALQEANGTAAADVIAFDIAGAGPHTIQPLSALPIITQPVDIDGTTEPDFAGTPVVVLDGTATGTGTVDGLTLTSSGSTVQGLVIHRFGGSGILITGPGATGNTVVGNYLGTDATGTIDLGNSFYGVYIAGAPSNRIGTDGDDIGDAAERNLISGNDQSGVFITGAGATGNTVSGNYIGTDVTGTQDLGNGVYGIWIDGAPSNRVGTDGDGSGDAAEGNLISGNDQVGVYVTDAGSTGNTVSGNYIGTDVTGTQDLGNGSGVYISRASMNRVGTDGDGSSDLAERNLISGNDFNGVFITGTGATGNTVSGNYIGTDVTGMLDLGNTLSGVLIDSDVSMNTVGGPGAGEGNTIAFNDEAGVVVTDAASTGNALVSNSIFENTDLGIDLGDDGVTDNDPGDADASSNKLQNWPVVTSVLDTGGGTFDVTYLVDTNPANAAYPLRVEFFAADVDEEEGQTFLAADTYATADFAAGAKTVAVTPSGAFTAIVATATDADGNTSEFSVPQPLLTAEKTAVPGGMAQPGDRITYTVVLTSQGSGSTLDLTFSDTVDGNTALDCTTNPPTTSQGTITACDAATGLVAVDVGSLAASASATITIEATVDNPIAAGVDAVCNQGIASGTNIADVVTDDPGTPAPDDATCVSVEAAPMVTAAKTDALVVDQDSDGQADPGDSIAYTIVIDNTGNEAADTVVLTDTPGVNTTLVVGSVQAPGGTILQGNNADDTTVEVRFDVIDGEPGIAAKAAETVTFQVVVNDPFPTDVQTVQNQGTVSFLDDGQIPRTILTDDPDTAVPNDPTVTPIDVSADVSLTKTASSTTPDFGGAVTFTLTLTNDGPLDATAVVTDFLPDGLAYVSDTGGGAYDPAKGTWQSGPLTAGATATLSIIARVETIAPVTNTAEVTFASLPDPDSTPADGQGDDYASVTLTPVAADLALDKKITAFSGDPNGPGAGDDTVTATFLLTVTNHGPSAATGVFVNDPLPEGATLDAAVPTQGLYDLPSGVWSVGTLAVGASASLTVTMTAGAGHNLYNRAEVFADQPDQNPSNNRDGVAAQHDPDDLDRFRADLSLTKTVDNAIPSPDDLVIYTITVRNSGPSTTAGVVVADHLPEGLAFVGAVATTTTERCPACGYDEAQGVWIVGHLPKDSTARLSLTARVTGTGEIVNRAEVLESHLPDPDSVFGDGEEGDDDTDTAVITVTPGKLAGALREGVASGKGGAALRYEVGANYPNPFNPETVIPFSLPEAQPVRVEVYNLLGQRVALLVDASVGAGRHEVVWQATDQPS